jgi:predicted MFS family arabinose efflux permease
LILAGGNGDVMSLISDSGSRHGGPAQSDSVFLTALGIGQICSWGSLYYSFPQLAEAMGRDLGWSKPELYGAATLGLALSGLAAYPVGVAIDRGHGRLVMGGASIFAGTLMLLWSQVQNIVVFYLLFAGIGASIAATLYEPAFAVIARRFGPTEARRGITAITLWGGFASTVFVPLIQILIIYVGWRGALVALGLTNILLCGTLYLTAIRPDLDFERGFTAPAASGPSSKPGAVHHALRNPIFWALAVSLTAYAATYSAFTFHLYPLLIERGLDAVATVAVLGCIGPAQVTGRIAVWLFAAEAPVRSIGSIIVAIFPIGFAAIAFLPPEFLFMAAVAMIYGAANGVMTIVRGMMVPEMLSRESYGAINGLLVAPSMIARAVAPAGAAALWATTQNYDSVVTAIITGAILTALGFWIAAWLGRPSARR